jgi:hypothetical protein
MNIVDFDHLKKYGNDVILSVLYEKACESGLVILAEILEAYWESQEDKEDD